MSWFISDRDKAEHQLHTLTPMHEAQQRHMWLESRPPRFIGPPPRKPLLVSLWAPLKRAIELWWNNNH